MNNNVGEKYLPVGTVVILTGAEKRLMITGFGVAPEGSKGELYDYSGCLYPEGIVSPETAVFNHNQIEKVFHMGLIDEEEKKFKINLVRAINNVNSRSSNVSKVNSDANDNQIANVGVNNMTPNPLDNQNSNVVPNLMGDNTIANAEVGTQTTVVLPSNPIPDLMGQQQNQQASQQQNQQNGLPSANRFLTGFDLDNGDNN